MTPNMLTSIIAAGVLFAGVGPFLLEWLLTRRGEAYLRLARRVQEERQSGFVNGCGPVRRATVWDVRDAEERIARTAWRAWIVRRPRDCGERRAARRELRRLLRAPARRHPRHCAPRRRPTAWWFTFPPPRPVPAGVTPHQAVVAQLREALS